MMVKIIMIKKLSLINVSCNLMRIIQAMKANRRREKDKLLSHKEDNFDSSILQPVNMKSVDTRRKRKIMKYPLRNHHIIWLNQKKLIE